MTIIIIRWFFLLAFFCFCKWTRTNRNDAHWLVLGRSSGRRSGETCFCFCRQLIFFSFVDQFASTLLHSLHPSLSFLSAGEFDGFKFDYSLHQFAIGRMDVNLIEFSVFSVQWWRGGGSGGRIIGEREVRQWSETQKRLPMFDVWAEHRPISKWWVHWPLDRISAIALIHHRIGWLIIREIFRIQFKLIIQRFR